jgi:hypothetical protein
VQRGCGFPVQESSANVTGAFSVRRKNTQHSPPRIDMETSKAIAGLLGPTLVAVAAALFLNLGSSRRRLSLCRAIRHSC